MGMKKSVVATIAWSSLSFHTAASSEVSVPTRRSGKGAAAGVFARISCRTAGAILQPQPPPWARLVSRTDWVLVVASSKRRLWVRDRADWFYSNRMRPVRTYYG